MLNKVFYFIVLTAVCISGCSKKDVYLSPPESAVSGNITKAVVMLTQDDAYDNNKIIRDGISKRLYKNSSFGHRRGEGSISLGVCVETTREHYGVYPVRVKWEDKNGNTCLEARYPVSYNRCYGGRGFCAYIGGMDSSTTYSSQRGCSKENYDLATADAMILHNPSMDVFDAFDTYKDEAFKRLSE